MSNFLTRSFLISFVLEHGNTYIDVMQPVFDVLKARHFDTSWNWVYQDGHWCHCESCGCQTDRRAYQLSACGLTIKVGEQHPCVRHPPPLPLALVCGVIYPCAEYRSLTAVCTYACVYARIQSSRARSPWEFQLRKMNADASNWLMACRTGAWSCAWPATSNT